MPSHSAPIVYRLPSTVFRLSFTVLTLSLFGAGCTKIPSPTINSFDDCAKYYPVMESYPEQCRTPDGRHFVRPLTDEEKEKTKSPAICVDKCGDNVCQEIVCLATNCPCAEIPESCPQDCANLQLSTMGTLAGEVTIGPICPVERVDQPCPVPPETYTSRELIIYKADGKTFVTSTHFKSDGTYSITLPPSNYTADVSRTGPFGSSKDTPHPFKIHSSRTTTFNLDIDTGIRPTF